jgi:hypothetical protein
VWWRFLSLTKSSNCPLITYERAVFIQAEREKFFLSTVFLKGNTCLQRQQLSVLRLLLL